MEQVRTLAGLMRQQTLRWLGRGNAHALILSGTVALAGLGAAAVNAAPAGATTPAAVTTVSSGQQGTVPATYYSYGNGPCHHHDGAGDNSGTGPVNGTQP